MEDRFSLLSIKTGSLDSTESIMYYFNDDDDDNNMNYKVYLGRSITC